MIHPQQVSEEVRQFIVANAEADIPSLVLKYKTIDGVPIADIADQIVGKRKARTKLPTYFAHMHILYPPTLNLEQTSSEETAGYKSQVLSSVANDGTVVDLTGGFGIDSMMLSRAFHSVIHVEHDAGIQTLAAYNHALLGCANIVYENTDAQTFLSSSPNVSAVYIDPSRRKSTRKVYSFHDCQPDITELQHVIFGITEALLVKASPMHDIQLALREVRHVRRVMVVAVDNEVRELLLLAVRNFDGPALLSAVNISNGVTHEFEFTPEDEQRSAVAYAAPMSYLYEPYASLLKAGGFKVIASRFHVSKLQVNTHLYTSERFIADFPGRIFRVNAFVKANKKSVSVHFPDGRANVIVRNYPSTPEELKKKLKLNDGSDRYLLAFTSPDGPMLVAAERLA
jgi:hypothetical protein